MPYNAVVCNVMIASPSDVHKERDMAREVIWNWNYSHSERTKIVLMPVGWETHTAPAMGDRPQAIINKQVLLRCDLLIGIFWTRLGTPTGQEVSGTVEEIKAHREKGKPVMLYFSSALVRPDSLEGNQYKHLKDFQEQSQKEGLIETYEDIAEFKDKLTRHLIKTVDDHEYFKNVVNESIPSQLLEASTAFKPERQLSKEARDLELPVVDVISSGFRIERDSTGAVARIVFIAGLYVKPRSEQEIVFPRHDCTVHITAPGSFPRTPFKTIWLMEGDDRHKSGAVPNEIVVDRPKAVDLWAFMGPLPLVDGQKAEVSISLLPVNARTPIVIRHEIIFPTAPGPAKRANP